MSLFPAYSSASGSSPVGLDNALPAPAYQPPTWLNNTSFKVFQEKVNTKQPIEVSSDTESENVEKPKKKKKKKRKKRRNTAITSESDIENSGTVIDDNVIEEAHIIISSDDSEKETRTDKKASHKIRNRSRSRSGKRKKRRNKSKSRSRERLRSVHKKGSRRKSRSRSRRRNKHSRSRSPSTNRTLMGGKKSSDLSSTTNREEIIANSKHSAKKVFIEEVGVSLANAFREDRLGDRTNLAGPGLYARDVAKYKNRIRYPMGMSRRKQVLKQRSENPRFYAKTYLKQLLKRKQLTKMNKDTISRSKDEVNIDFLRAYLSLSCNDAPLVKTEIVETTEDNSDKNPLGIYSAKTEEYLKGIGGLETEEKGKEVFENEEIQRKRLEFNAALRDQPTNVDLWMEFIDFQDEALEETVFQLGDDDKQESRKSRKKNGEILRAKALTERKLAICRSAIEKNTRSIDLAVKRLELSRDLFDSKTLDQQWKELIFVYPENVALWKRYLLFVQTHYIRFNIPDTERAYKGCIQKLRSQQEKYIADNADNKRGLMVLEIEQGMVDILDNAALLLVQSGHSEKAVAMYQGLLELNLFSPGLGNYSVEDKLSLLEPIWDSGVPRVGQVGARGWGKELQERIGEGMGNMSDVSLVMDNWEERLLAGVEGEGKGKVWLLLEGAREAGHFFPWRKGEEEPEDPERIVDFDCIQGYMVEFSREEVKLRVLLSLLRLLGVEVREGEFAPLVQGGVAGLYLNTSQVYHQDFQDRLGVLQGVVPDFRTREEIAIFTHFLYAQTYNMFSEPLRTKLMGMWLDFECEVVDLNCGGEGGGKALRKDLKKLARSLLKEDRNNVELVVKFSELEYRLSGYAAAQAVLDTSLTSLPSNQVVVVGEEEDGQVLGPACLLYRAGVELELREMVRLRLEGGSKEQEDDTVHRNRVQWLLVQLGSKTAPYKSLTEGNKMSMLAQVDGARTCLQDWLGARLDQNIKVNVFKTAPFVRHLICEVVFFYGWLLRFSSGLQEAVETLQGYSDTVALRIKSEHSRFREQFLGSKFIQESIDKVCFDLLWFDSLFDIKLKQQLRTFFIRSLKRHPDSGYFISRLSRVEDSTSVVSSVWREVIKIVTDKSDIKLLEQVCRLGLTKFIQVLDPDQPGQLPALGLGFLNRLARLLERQTRMVGVRHSPLLWRLLMWATSVLNSKKNLSEDGDSFKAVKHSSEACESLKTVLYRAIQDVPWSKALYMDTALYLDKVGELYTTTRTEVKVGDGEDHSEDELVEPKFEEVPGTLEHVTELMVEKDLRVRLPLPELDVLLDPT